MHVTDTIAALDDTQSPALVGSKAFNLAKMLAARLPVPLGFVVTTQAFDQFIEMSGLSNRISRLLDRIDASQVDRLIRISEEIRELILAVPIESVIDRQLRMRYRELFPQPSTQPGPVACRSSATLEDTPDASAAGAYDTFLHVCGPDNVLNAVRNCWASLYSDRALSYWGSKIKKAKMAVIVQQMVNATKAGVFYTSDPESTQQRHFMIEAVLGYGEALVSGYVTPTQIVVDRAPGIILETHQGDQEPDLLTMRELQELVSLGHEIEALFGKPQDVEWAIEDVQPYILQARDIVPSPR